MGSSQTATNASEKRNEPATGPAQLANPSRYDISRSDVVVPAAPSTTTVSSTFATRVARTYNAIGFLPNTRKGMASRRWRFTSTTQDVMPKSRADMPPVTTANELVHRFLLI